MTQLYLKNTGRFIFLVFFQVLILNHINLGGFINPYFYVYFILLLPFITPKWLLLVSAFLIGIFIDLFSNGDVCHGRARPFARQARLISIFCTPLLRASIDFALCG